jgi:rhodanese-related sulfurtransferase
MNNKIINVLAPSVYEDCHIKDTVNVPLDQLVEYVKRFPKDTEFIVYCAHSACPLSREAYHVLNDLGYTNIVAYEGGIAQWYQQGLPVEGPCKEDYLREPHSMPGEDPAVKTISIQNLKNKIK